MTNQPVGCPFPPVRLRWQRYAVALCRQMSTVVLVVAGYYFPGGLKNRYNSFCGFSFCHSCLVIYSRHLDELVEIYTICGHAYVAHSLASGSVVGLQLTSILRQAFPCVIICIYNM